MVEAVTTFDADLVALVDQRIRSNQYATSAVGVVASRSSVADADVVFDGSQGAIPVKIAADVIADEGDRVLLNRFGSWWVIVGSMAYRGRKSVSVADRNARIALTNLIDGDRVYQQDTSVPYFWNGSQWVVEPGASIYSWVKGPGLGTNFRIIVGATNEVAVHSTNVPVEMEGGNLFYLTSSIQVASGVAGNHFFHTYIKDAPGGNIIVESGEDPYTGTFDPIRSTISQAGVVTTGVTLATLELTVKDNSGAQYDVYGDQNDPAYFHITGAGRVTADIDTT